MGSLSGRKKEILRTVIEQYVETAEPVGSKTIAQNLSTPVSSATIRNEMAELEDMGLLEQPHTSAGRIPTAQGYRIYVNELMTRHRLSIEETQTINRGLKSRMAELDRALAEAGKLASQMTRYPAYALAAASGEVTISRFDLIPVDGHTFIIVALLSNDTVKNKLVHLPVAVEAPQLVKLATLFNASFTKITEDKITPGLISATERAAGDQTGLVAVIAGYAIEILYEIKTTETHVEGAMSLLNHPEYRDVSKAQRVMQYLSDDRALIDLSIPADSRELKIMIGPENVADALKDSSVVVVKYDAGEEMQGLIGVVGPTRMDYSKVIARLSYIAHGLGLRLTGEMPPGLPEGEDTR